MANACVCGERLEVNDAGELCIVPGSNGFRQQVIYASPGVHQFRKDDYPWLARVRVQVQAAGGGSAGANAAPNELIARPGGAGGGWSESVIEAAALGAVETVVVGAGGAAGVGNNPGSAGGPSSFGGFCSAVGGDGGTANMTSGTTLGTAQGIAGPLAGTGDHISGGGAGGSAIRLTATQGASGSGGESRLGHGGLSRTTEGPGTAPRGRGGGAGGAFSLGESVPGADGGDGIVIIELYA